MDRRTNKMLKPQKDFKYLDLYKEKFNITDKTIFAFDGDIYCDYDLPHHLLVHEKVHLLQQGKNPHEWVFNYLNSDKFRLNQEVGAYKAEIASIKDKNERLRHLIYCSKILSSDLYGEIISYEEAYKLLK